MMVVMTAIINQQVWFDLKLSKELQSSGNVQIQNA